MPLGEQIMRVSVWVALMAATFAVFLGCRAEGRARWLRNARWAWTMGCACFAVHVTAAFTTIHHWSHQSAYDAVARQTNDFAGLNWGGGIYFNYLFAAAWVADVGWWWLHSQAFPRRPRWMENVWHGYFFFMTVNGAVVFVHGPARWLGVFLCTVMAWCWWRDYRQKGPKIRALLTD